LPIILVNISITGHGDNVLAVLLQYHYSSCPYTSMEQQHCGVGNTFLPTIDTWDMFVPGESKWASAIQNM